MMKYRAIHLAVLLSFATGCMQHYDRHVEITWGQWSEDVFDLAAQQQRPVLVDVKAKWCTWCKVMDNNTYGHPDVATLINERFLPVKVDFDEQAEVAQSFGAFFLPMTVILTPDRRELYKESGAIGPEQLLPVLKDCLSKFEATAPPRVQAARQDPGSAHQPPAQAGARRAG